MSLAKQNVAPEGEKHISESIRGQPQLPLGLFLCRAPLRALPGAPAPKSHTPAASEDGIPGGFRLAVGGRGWLAASEVEGHLGAGGACAKAQVSSRLR